MKRIFEYTRAIPLEIIRVCITAWIAGRVDQKLILADSATRQAIAGLDHMELASSRPRTGSVLEPFLCRRKSNRHSRK